MSRIITPESGDSENNGTLSFNSLVSSCLRSSTTRFRTPKGFPRYDSKQIEKRHCVNLLSQFADCVCAEEGQWPLWLQMYPGRGRVFGSISISSLLPIRRKMRSLSRGRPAARGRQQRLADGRSSPLPNGIQRTGICDFIAKFRELGK